ncbi:MAG: hypothetical protein Q8M79_03205 [Dehalococcoidia bacterium]|nr:hypothetical protein [Dehalococcoidia bacterium]
MDAATVFAFAFIALFLVVMYYAWWRPREAGEREVFFRAGYVAGRDPSPAQATWRMVEESSGVPVPDVIRWALEMECAGSSFDPALVMSNNDTPAPDAQVMTSELRLRGLAGMAREVSEIVKPGAAGDWDRARKWVRERQIEKQP